MVQNRTEGENFNDEQLDLTLKKDQMVHEEQVYENLSFQNGVQKVLAEEKMKFVCLLELVCFALPSDQQGLEVGKKQEPAYVKENQI